MTNDMREIADGLGSGVTPDQLETAVKLGEEWLEDIKQYDFSEERQKAIDKKLAANELVDKVKEFAAPVESFDQEVANVGEVIIDLRDKLDDLRNNSDRTRDMVSPVIWSLGEPWLKTVKYF